MAVSSTISTKTYSPGAAMAAEALTGIMFLDPDHLVVELWLEGAESGTELTRDVDYTIGGDGAAAAGTITALAAHGVADEFRIRRETPLTQPEVLPKYEPLSAKDMERGLDRLALQNQEQFRDYGRVLKGPVGVVMPSIDWSDIPDGAVLVYDEDSGQFIWGNPSADWFNWGEGLTYDAETGTITLDNVDPPIFFTIAVSDEFTPIDVTGVMVNFPMAMGMEVTSMEATLEGACTTGTFTLDVLADGVSILSTPITIDPGEATSETAAVPYVIANGVIAQSKKVSIAVTGLGDASAFGLRLAVRGKLTSPGPFYIGSTLTDVVPPSMGGTGVTSLGALLAALTAEGMANGNVRVVGAPTVAAGSLAITLDLNGTQLLVQGGEGTLDANTTGSIAFPAAFGARPICIVDGGDGNVGTEGAVNKSGLPTTTTQAIENAGSGASNYQWLALGAPA